MKFIYETPDIELNKFKFADVLSSDDGTHTASMTDSNSYVSETIPEQDDSRDPFGDGN